MHNKLTIQKALCTLSILQQDLASLAAGLFDEKKERNKVVSQSYDVQKIIWVLEDMLGE